MAGSDNRPFLDRPAARLVALSVLVLCAASLAYLHRDDLWTTPEEAAETAPSDPAAPCIEARFADIDQMVTDETIETAQAALFKQRAEAMCRDTAFKTPLSPGLPAE